MKRLLVDLEVCRLCKKCTAECSYFYHPGNKGFITVLESATRAEICRKCEEAPCVAACPREALEKEADSIVRRFTMRCVGCNTCVLACPFGAIHPEIIPYLGSQCDYCADRLNGEQEPLCVRTCPEGALKYLEIDESTEKNIRSVGDKLVVHSIAWRADKLDKKP